MAGKKAYLNLVVRLFAWVSIFDAVITVIAGMYAMFMDEPHPNIRLVFGIGFFNKLFPTLIISLILLCAKGHSNKVDATAGWVIVMLLNFIWDIGFLGVGFKWVKYDGNDKYTGDSIKSVLFLLVYKVIFSLFFLVSIVYAYIFIHAHPEDVNPHATVRRYASIPAE